MDLFPNWCPWKNSKYDFGLGATVIKYKSGFGGIRFGVSLPAGLRLKLKMEKLKRKRLMMKEGMGLIRPVLKICVINTEV